MKSEQAAFGVRLSAALATAGVEASPSELVKLLARYGGTPVTPQAISGWLNGKHMPRQANMRALAAMVGVEPVVLQYGGTSGRGVREPRTAWPENVKSRDRLAFEEFLALPAAQRKLVRELIAAFTDASARGKHSH
jgi:sugar phosphate isomerase/epimerase